MVVKNKVVNKLKEGCNYDTLKKLCNQRGLNIHQSRPATELELAYVEGYNVDKSEKADKEFCTSKEEKRKNICLKNIYENDSPLFLKLNQSQIDLLEWLVNDVCLIDEWDYTEVGDIEFIEI